MNGTFNLSQGSKKLLMRLTSFVLIAAMILAQRASFIPAYAEETRTDNGNIVEEKILDRTDTEAEGNIQPEGSLTDQDGSSSNPDGVTNIEEITLKVKGNLEDFSGLNAQLDMLDGNVQEKQAFGENGEVVMTLPAEADTFRLLIYGIAETAEIADKSWALTDGVYSREFGRQELVDLGGTVVVEVNETAAEETPVETPEEPEPVPFSITVQVQKVQQEQGIIAQAFGFFSNLLPGNNEVAGLNAKLVQLDENGNDIEPPLATGTTGTDGAITLTGEFVPVEGAKYRLYLSNFPEGYIIDGWELDVNSYYIDLSAADLQNKTEVPAMMALGEGETETGDVITYSITIDVDTNQHRDGVSATLFTKDSDGNVNFTETKKTGAAGSKGNVQWDNLPRMTYYLTVESPDDHIYLSEASNEIGTITLIESMPIDGGKRYKYTFELVPAEPKWGSIYANTITFLDNDATITITKMFDDDSEFTDKELSEPIWFGIVPKSSYGTESMSIDWKLLVRNPDGSYSVTFDVERYADLNPGTGVISSALKAYYLFEYCPNYMKPLSVGSISWVQSKPGLNYPNSKELTGYVMYEQAKEFTINQLPYILSVTNERYELDFPPGSKYELAWIADPLAYKGKMWEWTTKKVADPTSIDLTNDSKNGKRKGDSYTVDYTVEFTRNPVVTNVVDATLYFNNVYMRLLYDHMAAIGSNYVEGTFQLYKDGVAVTGPNGSCSVRQDLVRRTGTDQGYDFIRLYSNTLSAPFKQGSIYKIVFTGNYHYNNKGNPTEGNETLVPIIKEAPFTANNVKVVEQETNPLDPWLKDFKDTITFPAELVGVPSDANVTAVKVNGKEVQFKVTRSDGSVIVEILGTLDIDDTSGKTKTIVTYTVEYQDKSWNIPCSEGYKIDNVAFAKGKDTSNNTLSAEAQVAVETDAEAYIKVKKMLSGTNITTVSEAGVKFALYDNLGKTLLGTATSIKDSFAIIMAGNGYLSETGYDSKEKYYQMALLQEPSASSRYRLYVMVAADTDYPPYYDGAKMTYDGTIGGWYVEVKLTANSSGTYEGKYCGPTEITVDNKPDTDLTITKTGGGYANALFYYLLKDSTGNATPITGSVSGTTKTFSIKNLAYGTYILYELTDLGFAPQGWTDLKLVAPTTYKGISVLAGKVLYQKEVTLSSSDRTQTEGVKNDTWQELKITKSVPNGVHSGARTFEFQVKDSGGNTLGFTSIGAAGDNTYRAGGTTTPLKLTWAVGETADKTITITGLAPGSYTVEEILDSKDNPLTVNDLLVYDVTPTPANNVSTVVVDTAGSNPTATFTNKLKDAGEITVEKKVTGGAGNEDFTFTVLKKNGDSYEPVVLTKDVNITFSTTGIGTVPNQTTYPGTFTLTHGAKATIKNLEFGSTYVIKEQGGSFTTTHTVAVDGAIRTETINDPLATNPIILTDKNVDVVFTNARGSAGSLTVKKTVPAGSYLQGNEVFVIRVTGKFKGAGDIITNEITRYVYFTEDGRDVTPLNGATGDVVKSLAWNGAGITYTDVVNGEVYTVEEIDYNTQTQRSNYSVTVTGVDSKLANGYGGTFTMSGDRTVEITNKYSSFGELLIKKALENSSENGKEFTVYLTDGDGKYLVLSGPTGTNNEYKVTGVNDTGTPVKISVNKTAKIVEIPLGWVITVLETGIPTGYSQVGTAASVKIANKNHTVTITNTTDVGLTVTKKLVDPVGFGANDVFTITVTEQGNSAFNFSTTFGNATTTAAHSFGDDVTVPNVRAGATYTVTESANSTILNYYTTTATGFDSYTSGNRFGSVTIAAGTTDNAVVFTNTRHTASGELKKVLENIKEGAVPSRTDFYFRLQSRTKGSTGSWVTVDNSEAGIIHIEFKKIGNTWTSDVVKFDNLDPAKEYQVVELDPDGKGGYKEVLNGGKLGEYFDVKIVNKDTTATGASAHTWTFKVTNTALDTGVTATIQKKIIRGANTFPKEEASFEFTLYEQVGEEPNETADVKVGTATVKVPAGATLVSNVESFKLNSGVTLDSTKTYYVKETLPTNGYKPTVEIITCEPTTDKDKNTKAWAFTAENYEPGARAQIKKVLDASDDKTPTDKKFKFNLYYENDQDTIIGTATDVLPNGAAVPFKKDGNDVILDPTRPIIVKEVDDKGKPIGAGGKYNEDGGYYDYIFGVQPDKGVTDDKNVTTWTFTAKNTLQTKKASGKIIKIVEMNGQSKLTQSVFEFDLYEMINGKRADNPVNGNTTIKVTVTGTGGTRTGSEDISSLLDPNKEYQLVEVNYGDYKTDKDAIIPYKDSVEDNKRTWEFTATNTELAAKGMLTKTLVVVPGTEFAEREFKFQLQQYIDGDWKAAPGFTQNLALKFSSADISAGIRAKTQTFDLPDPRGTYRVVELDAYDKIIEPEDGKYGLLFDVTYDAGKSDPDGKNIINWTFTVTNTEIKAKGKLIKEILGTPGSEFIEREFKFLLQQNIDGDWVSAPGFTQNLTLKFTAAEIAADNKKDLTFNLPDPRGTYRIIEVGESEGKLGEHFEVEYSNVPSEPDGNITTWTFTVTNTFIPATIKARIEKTVDRNSNETSEHKVVFELIDKQDPPTVYGTATVIIDKDHTTGGADFTITKPLNPDAPKGTYTVREKFDGDYVMHLSEPVYTDDRTNTNTITWTFEATNCEASARAKITKTVVTSGLNLTARDFNFRLYDGSNAIGYAKVEYPDKMTVDFTKANGDTLVLDPNKTYTVREVDASGTPINGSGTITVGGQQFRVTYGDRGTSKDEKSNVTTWTYTATNTALIAQGMITKTLTDADLDNNGKLKNTSFTFGIYEGKASNHNILMTPVLTKTITINQTTDANGTNKWRAASDTFTLPDYDKEYYVKETGVGSGNLNDYTITENSIPVPSGNTKTWSFTVDNVKKTASIEITKYLTVKGTTPLQTTFSFYVYETKTGGTEARIQTVNITVQRPASGNLWSGKAEFEADFNATYRIEEVNAAALRNMGYTVNTERYQKITSIDGLHTSWYFIAENVEPDIRTARAIIYKDLYTDYTNPRRNFSFNIYGTKNGVRTLHGTYDLTVVQIGNNHYTESTLPIEGLDPDATYTAEEVGADSLRSQGYTIGYTSTQETGTITTWRFYFTNTRYTSGGGGGGGDGSTSRDGDGSVTITDLDVPLTNIPDTQTPLAALPTTGRFAAALIGSAGLLMLGIVLRVGRKREEE